MDKDNPARLEHFSQNSPISLRPVRMRTLNPVTRYIVDGPALWLTGHVFELSRSYAMRDASCKKMLRSQMLAGSAL